MGKPRAFPNFNTYLGEHNQSQMCSSKKYIFTLLKCFSPLFFFLLKTTPGQRLPVRAVAKYRFIEWLKLVFRPSVNGVLNRANVYDLFFYGSGITFRKRTEKVGLNHNNMHKKNEPKVLLIIIQGQQTPTELTWEEIFKKWENLCLDTHKYPTSLGQTVRRKSGTCEPCQCYDSAAWRPPGNVLPTFSDHLGGLHILFSSSRDRERGGKGRKWGAVWATDREDFEKVRGGWFDPCFPRKKSLRNYSQAGDLRGCFLFSCTPCIKWFFHTEHRDT